MLRRIFTGKFPAYSPPVDVYLGLRNLIFSSRPPGWMATAGPTDLWGVLMETGYSSGVATLVALADDTVSLYYSTGGGAIGLGPNDGPRRAAQLLLRTLPDFCENSRALVRTRCLPWQRCVSTSSRETKRRQPISRKTNSGVGDTRCHHYSTLPTRSFRRLGVWLRASKRPRSDWSEAS